MLENNEEDAQMRQEDINNDDEMDEWEMLSQLVPPNIVQVSDIETLGRRDFDLINVWNSTTCSNKNLEDPPYFIRYVRSSGSIPDLFHSRSTSPSSFSDKQCICSEFVIENFNEGPNANPLKMIIQGTAGTGKYYLI